MSIASESAKAANAAYMREYRHNQSAEARAAQAAYLREWRRKNPEKVKAANIRYWEKRAQRAAQAQAELQANQISIDGI